MGSNTGLSMKYKVQDNCIEGYEGNVLVSLLYITDLLQGQNIFYNYTIKNYHNEHTERINDEWIYYGTSYHFKFTDEKYHRYATLIVSQHIELLFNNTDLPDAELKKLIVEEWFGLENDMTREANNKEEKMREPKTS